MNTFFPASHGATVNGGTFIAANTAIITQSKRGLDLLLEFIATDALHNSGADLYDAPKCHPHTRIAVLGDIMKWVIESEAQEEFMMWLFGPAGAGKTAIARKIAELAMEKGLLIGTFFFSRTSPTRSTHDRLVATLAYQLAVSIPGTRIHIENAIERDPAIFHKNIQTQIDTLIITPFRSASRDTAAFEAAFPKLFIIDGLDECTNSQAQATILDAISQAFSKHKLPIICLIVSRPEARLFTSFNGNEPLKSIHRRIALDDNYRPDDDIRLFFSDKFEQIRCAHRLRSTIPIPWPTKQSLDALVEKSSGQFIFAATVMRFVESNRHRPATRLNIILGMSPPGTINPFTGLDALYRQTLSSVDDIQLTLRVLSVYALSPYLAGNLGNKVEGFLSLEEGDIDRALIDLSSIVSYDESSGKVRILHASLVDFLYDPRRSDEFYIDMASARSDFACRTLQCVKGPDGMLAGDLDVFRTGVSSGWILNSQLKNEILHFDLDAFITAAINFRSPYSRRGNVISRIFDTWTFFISQMGLDDGDEQLLMHRCKNSFESRVQKYQSDWHLKLLLTLTIVTSFSKNKVSRCRCLDILLEMDDKGLHLVDQHALDLRYSDAFFRIYTKQLGDITSRYIDGHSCASAALHCMRFLSNPPKYADSNDSLEVGITYGAWKATCEMALRFLKSLLDRASTSSEALQFMSDNDIHTMIRKNLHFDLVRRLDIHILAFLSRGGACVNWRILSAIHQAFSATNKSAAARGKAAQLRWQALGNNDNIAGDGACPKNNQGNNVDQKLES